MKSFEEFKADIIRELETYIERIKQQKILHSSKVGAFILATKQVLHLASGDEGLAHAEEFLSQLRKFKSVGELIYYTNNAHWGPHSQKLLMGELVAGLSISRKNVEDDILFDSMHETINDELQAYAEANILDKYKDYARLIKKILSNYHRDVERSYSSYNY